MEKFHRASSGILLPKTAKEKPQTGLIIAVDNDEDIPVKANGKILFPKHIGTGFKTVKTSCF